MFLFIISVGEEIGWILLPADGKALLLLGRCYWLVGGSRMLDSVSGQKILGMPTKVEVLRLSFFFGRKISGTPPEVRLLSWNE